MVKIDVIPAGPPMGAEIRGADLSQPLDGETFEAVQAAFDEYRVVFFRDQALTPDQQIAFARRFGEIEFNAFNKWALDGHPEILIVSNIKENGKDVGYADAGSHWHTDMSYEARPPRITMLYAIEVPLDDDGRALGDTVFADATTAYETLPADAKSRIDGRQAIHRFAAKTRGVKKPVKLSDEQLAAHPDIIHPVARTHPRTGRKALYVRDGECVGIVGMPDAEAVPLIKELADRTIRPEFLYRHRWQAGDLLMWDNAAVHHWAPRDYAWPQRRRMHRITVDGAETF
jgi:taurine dioxygenase